MKKSILILALLFLLTAETTSHADDLFMQTGSVSRTDFEASPLDPSWIIEGNPISRSLALTTSSDGSFSSGLWECTAGKFKFYYYTDEIVHILEGEAIVRNAGKEYTLRAGDTAHFPEGLTAYWTIPKYVRKFAIYRVASRSLLERISYKIRKFFY